MPMKTRIPFLVVLSMVCMPQHADAKARPSFRWNLKQYGYVESSSVDEYSSLGFLSDDLLLVTLNQRTFRGTEPVTTDKPPSKLLLFQLSARKVIRSALMAVAKSPRSVVPLCDGDFLVASVWDVRLCSSELRCVKSFVTNAGAPIDSGSVKLLTGLGDLILRPEDASADGKRSISSELSSTVWNKISHPIDIDEPRRPDHRELTVFDKTSNKTLISLHYNPKNQIVGAAISPGGTKLAIVRHGVLEVYDIR